MKLSNEMFDWLRKSVVETEEYSGQKPNAILCISNLKVDESALDPTAVPGREIEIKTLELPDLSLKIITSVYCPPDTIYIGQEEDFLRQVAETTKRMALRAKE